MRMTVKGRVTNGRLVVDEPTDLPEGAVVELRLVEPQQDESIDARESLLVDNGPLLDAMQAIARSVPDECWARLPIDAAEKLDEHLRRGIR
jgi:hypothetical protein